MMILRDNKCKHHNATPFSEFAFATVFDLQHLLHILMSDKRRAEIEAKRAKLNELKKARAERQKAENEKKRQEVGIEFIKLSVQIPFTVHNHRSWALHRGKQMYQNSLILSYGVQVGEVLILLVI